MAAMTSFGTEDFIIDANKKSLVERYKGKIDRLFGAKIAFDVVSEDGASRMQWLAVSGNRETRTNAKNYILAMCEPQETSHVTCTGRPHIDDVILEEVERNTCAFLQRTGSQTLQVMGTDLACTLAVSRLEQTYHVTNISKEQLEEDTAAPAHGKQLRLEEVRAKHNPSPTAVVQQMEGLVMDGSRQPPFDSFDDRELFASGESLPNFSSKIRGPSAVHRTAASQVISRGTAVPPSRSSRQTDPCTSLLKESERGSKAGDDQYSHCASSAEPTSDASKQMESMSSLGKGMGYVEEEIQEALRFFDFSSQDIRPDEFLVALDNIRTNKRKNGSEPSTSVQQGQGQAPRSGDTDSHSSAKNFSHHNKVDNTRQKTGKGKPHGRGQAHSASPPKTKAGTNPQKSPSLTNVPQPHRSGAHMASNSNSPSVGNNRVIFMGESPGGANSPGGGGGDDSVIFMGQELNNSVYIVDPPLDAGQHRIIPPERQSNATTAGPRSSSKRKAYSDDEDQTCVLKPYSSNTDSDYQNVSRQPDPQFSHGAPASSSAPPAASSSSTATTDSDLRYVVIDGSNVAMSHGNDKVFSCKGIKLCVDYFVKRRHRVRVWVPRTKTYKNQTGRHPPVIDQHILEELKDQGYLSFTPARTLNNKHIVSHDDYFILDLAEREDAVIVSNDNFREFVDQYGDLIGRRVLSFAFSDDHFMPPKDPLGRYGPTLDQFLRKTPSNPAKRAATEKKGVRPADVRADHQPGGAFGPRNPQAGHQPGGAFGPRYPQAGHQPGGAFGPRYPQAGHQPGGAFGPRYPQTGHQPGGAFGPRNPQAGFAGPRPGFPAQSHAAAKGHPRGPRPPVASHSTVRPAASVRPIVHKPEPVAQRHPDVTHDLLEALRMVFPEQGQKAQIERVLENHPAETDLNKLTNYCINALNA